MGGADGALVAQPKRTSAPPCRAAKALQPDRGQATSEHCFPCAHEPSLRRRMRRCEIGWPIMRCGHPREGARVSQCGEKRWRVSRKGAKRREDAKKEEEGKDKDINTEGTEKQRTQRGEEEGEEKTGWEKALPSSCANRGIRHDIQGRREHRLKACATDSGATCCSNQR